MAVLTEILSHAIRSMDGYEIFSVLFCFFLCPGTDISATMQPISVKFGTMVKLSPGRVFIPFSDDIFRAVRMRGPKTGRGR